jgi:hypothetical protein
MGWGLVMRLGASFIPTPCLSVSTDHFCLDSVHVHLEVSHRDANTMVSLDTPSRPDNPMDAAGAHRNNENPSGMRTTAESMNEVTLSSDPGSNMMADGSSSSSYPQTDEMPRGGGGAMDVSQVTAKGMQTMGSGTGMDGHEVCKQLEPDVPIYFQCPIPAVSTFPLTLICEIGNMESPFC